MTRYRNILLHSAAESLDPACGAAAYARSMAEAHGAHLTALVFELDVYTPVASTLEGGAFAMAQGAIQERNRMAEGKAAALRESLGGISADVRTERTYAFGVQEIVAQTARVNDLTVAGVAADGLLSERGVAEHALFQSGRPLIAVPDRHEAGYAARRIACAWDFGRTAARALADAMPLLARAEEVSLLTIGDEKALDSSVPMEALLAALERHGVRARHRQGALNGRRIGEALQGMARDEGADLLVMGAYGHSRFREFILGGATRGVLHAPALPVLMSH